jgi:Patatin-like phospholipase
MNPEPTDLFRILSLDGGGAKGFYTLGILNEIEAMIGRQPLCERFDLIFGTSGYSGEAERLFRRESERHSGMIPNTIGA